MFAADTRVPALGMEVMQNQIWSARVNETNPKVTSLGDRCSFVSLLKTLAPAMDPGNHAVHIKYTQ